MSPPSSVLKLTDDAASSPPGTSSSVEKSFKLAPSRNVVTLVAGWKGDGSRCVMRVVNKRKAIQLGGRRGR